MTGSRRLILSALSALNLELYKNPLYSLLSIYYYYICIYGVLSALKIQGAQGAQGEPAGYSFGILVE